MNKNGNSGGDTVFSNMSQFDGMAEKAYCHIVPMANIFFRNYPDVFNRI